MKINIAVAAGSAPKNWMAAMEREILAIIPGLDTENMDEVDGDHGTVIKTDDWNELLSAFKSKGYKTRKTGSSNFEVHDKKYGPRYGIYAEVDGDKTHLTWMTPDRGDEDDEDDMLSESSDHVATAAKSPTAAQLKKAAAVLKKAKAAKSDKLNGNLDELFASATALHKEADAAKRMNDAQVEKLRAQIDKLETKAENAYLKAAGKVKKVIDRAAKQMARMDKEGVKYTVPKVLASYFNLPAKSAAKADAADESLDSPTQLKKQLANLETSLKAIQGKKSEAAKRMRITKKIAALKERLASGKKTKRPSAE